ncbi:MAG: protein kinase [Rubripirellula sp.]|nr:protein kinase [Rubripirellula sp.]
MEATVADGGTGTVRDELSNPPLVEDYLNEFSDLNTPEIMLTLLQQEFWARARFSEEPEIEEYHERFPDFEINGASLTATDLALTVGSREEIERARSDDKRDGTEAMTVPPSAGAGQSEFDDIPDTVGNYRLDRELGAGGMGRVYRATDLNSGQEVALKLVLPQLVTSEESMDRFRQEGRLAGGITHPRCVFVLAADQDGRFPYIAMEFVPGTNLHDYVVSEGPLEQEDAIRKIIDVIDGLSAAHELGVIHRDIKPANCFVDDEGRVKVGDFGLSRTLTADIQLTQPGAFLGTPQYCAPEQIRNDPLDDRCDVYSVVATLYFTLTGQAPFHGSDALATMARVVSDPAPPIRKLRPDLPRGLEKVIAKGLERDPKRRWQSMQELKNALTEFLPGQLSGREQGGRIGSYWLDCLLYVVVCIPIGIVLGLAFGARYANSQFWPTLVAAIVFVTYFTVFEGYWGTTPGKRLCGFLVQVHGQGVPPSFLLAFLRVGTFVLIVDGVPHLFNWAMSHLVASAPERNPLRWVSLAKIPVFILISSTMRARNGFRGVHELVSGTCLIRRKKKHASSEAADTTPDWLAAESGQDVQIEGDWPRTVGPFQVSHAVRWDSSGRILACRDQELNRSVWLRFRAAEDQPVSQSRGQIDRKSRLRWVASGTHGDDHFDVFLAPSGRPLDSIVEEHGPLDWATVAPLLLSLAEELEHTINDGTLPDILSTQQVWLQSDGSVLLLDFPTSSQFQATAAGLLSPVDRCFALSGATAVRALEGGQMDNVQGRHETNQVVNAVIPVFAQDALSRLFHGRDRYEQVSEFTEVMAENALRPVQTIDWRARMKLSILQPVFAFFLTTILCLVMFFLFRNLLDAVQALVDETLALEIPPGYEPFFILLAPFPLSIWSFCFPRGFVWRSARIAIVDRTGSRVSRLWLAWRTWLVWFPFAVLLFLQNVIPADRLGSLTIEGEWGWVPWVTLAVIYLLISLIWPRRGPQDVLAGTYLVPR